MQSKRLCQHLGSETSSNNESGHTFAALFKVAGDAVEMGRTFDSTNGTFSDKIFFNLQKMTIRARSAVQANVEITLARRASYSFFLFINTTVVATEFAVPAIQHCIVLNDSFLVKVFSQ
jgi:hypothetical protein